MGTVLGWILGFIAFKFIIYLVWDCWINKASEGISDERDVDTHVVTGHSSVRCNLFVGKMNRLQKYGHFKGNNKFKYIDTSELIEWLKTNTTKSIFYICVPSQSGTEYTPKILADLSAMKSLENVKIHIVNHETKNHTGDYSDSENNIHFANDADLNNILRV